MTVLHLSECYATMVSVLATKYPQKTPQLMAYQRTILKAHRAFTGEGWVTYDTCYRRKAALMKSLDWGVVDFTLYNETFTGRAKVLPRCRHCSSEHHPSHACSYAPDQATESQQAPSRPARSPMRSASYTMANMGTGVISHHASSDMRAGNARGLTQRATAENVGNLHHQGQGQGPLGADLKKTG